MPMKLYRGYLRSQRACRAFVAGAISRRQLGLRELNADFSPADTRVPRDLCYGDWYAGSACVSCAPAEELDRLRRAAGGVLQVDTYV